jgi:hypothetical protein
MPPTIEDPDVLDKITQLVKERGYGVKANLVYLEDEMKLGNL